jgi:hypothetical protein
LRGGVLNRLLHLLLGGLLLVSLLWLAPTAVAGV